MGLTPIEWVEPRRSLRCWLGFHDWHHVQDFCTRCRHPWVSARMRRWSR